MIAPTHITFAEFVYLLILTAVGVPLSAANAAVLALGAVLPDIDTPASTVGRLVPPLSTRLERWYGHRTVTHSVVGMAAVAMAALPAAAVSADLYVCFVAGYVSHPLLDTMTVSGVKLFHPFSPVRCVFPFDGANPRRYRVRTGSAADKALAALFAVACLPLSLAAHQGYDRVIRLAQRSVAAAVRDYGEFSRSHLVVADVEAADALTKAPLRGRFAVVGALDGQTLLFRGADGDLHTLGKAFQAEYVAENVVCAEGGPARWEARAVDAAGKLLVQIREELAPADEAYLFGSVALDEEVQLPADARVFRPASAHGSVLTLNYASARDLERLGLDDRVVVRGILTVKARYAGGRSSGADDAARFAHTAFAFSEGDSMEVLVAPGDTIAVGSVLARPRAARAIAERVGLHREAAGLLAAERRDKAVQAGRAIAVAESALAAGAEELASTRALADSGYVPRAALAPLALREQKARGALEELRAAASRADETLALRIRREGMQAAELETRRLREEGRSAIRSTVAGVVAHVRTRSAGRTTQVTVIVRERRRGR